MREADTHDDGRDVARWCEDRVPPGLDKRDAAFDVTVTGYCPARWHRVGGKRDGRADVRRRGARVAETRRAAGGLVALGYRLRARARARERLSFLESCLWGISRRRRDDRGSVLPRPPAPRANLEALRDEHRLRLAVDVAMEESSGHRPFALDPVDLRQRERGHCRLDATHRHEVRVCGGYG